MGCNYAAIFYQFQTIQRHFFRFSRKSGDEIRADRGVRPRFLDPFDRMDRIGTAVTTLHPLEDQVVSSLERQVEMGKKFRLAGDELEQRLVDLHAVQR